MNKKLVGLFVGPVFALSASLAHAVPISYVFSETISSTFGLPGLSAGQMVDITVTLDNGGLNDISQTWTATDLESLTFDFNGGALVTTFNSPFDAGLDSSVGNFETNGAGMLTSVMSSWFDYPVNADFVTTGAGTRFEWFLNGGNAVYWEDTPTLGAVELNNVNTMLDPANWSKVSEQVPEPTTLALLSLGLVGLGFTRGRRKS